MGMSSCPVIPRFNHVKRGNREGGREEGRDTHLCKQIVAAAAL